MSLTDKLKKYLKILAVFIVALIVTNMMVGNIFVKATPKVSPTFLAKVKNMPKTLSELPSYIRHSLFQTKDTTPVMANANKEAQDVFNSVPKVTPPVGLSFVPMAKGVSAAEDAATKKKYITISGGVEYVVEETVINGKTYKVLHLVTGK